ncbi:hypothetical protein MCOR25_002955 [Pyricularia grisea]|nr:hypothetical protein MCOR25_002955 [Pyricularia grisea]
MSQQGSTPRRGPRDPIPLTSLVQDLSETLSKYGQIADSLSQLIVNESFLKT